MLVFILILTALEFIAVFLLISAVYRDNNIAKTHEDNVRALKNMGTQFSINREKVNSLMINIHGDAQFMSNLLSMQDMERVPYSLELQTENNMLSYLRVNESVNIAEVHIVGRPEIKLAVRTGVLSPIWDEFEKDYMQHVLDDPGKMIVYKPSNMNNIVYARAQPIMEHGEIRGYYCICISLIQNSTTEILKRHIADSSRQALSFLENGSIINRTSSIFENMTADDLDILYETAEAKGVCTNDTGEWVYNVQYMDAINMYVCVMAQMSSIDLTSRSFLLSIQIILIAMIFIAMISAFFITRLLNRPIQELTQQFGELLSAEHRRPLHITGSDELQSVAEGINVVLEKQEMLIRDNYKNKILEKNARIELLQVQINPHFIFNTLDIINWFIYENRNKEASKVLIALGEMMRYSTYRYKNFVTLGEEIKQIRNYLHIQLIRYDYSFEVDINVEEGMNDFMIPCLIIQPIVENSVKYGVSCKPSGGHISVSAMRNEDRLIITVFDNGIGMTREQIDSVLVEEEQPETEKTSGIGLRNVNERMKLLFGQEYAISIESDPGYFTQVTIQLPYRSEANESYHS